MDTGTLLTKASRRAISVASIFAAIGLLGGLLLLSSPPEEESFRSVDARLRYVQDVTVALDQTLDAALKRDMDVSSELGMLTKGMGGVSHALQRNLSAVYEPTGPLAYLRRSLMNMFNAVGTQQGTLRDSNVVAMRGELKQRTGELLTSVEDLTSIQGHWVETRVSMTDESRSLVRELRERGNDALADEVFRTEQQISNRLNRNGKVDGEQIQIILSRLLTQNQRLPAQDAARLDQLSASVNELVGIRQKVDVATAGIDLSGLRNTVESLRDATSADYMSLLSIANEARILLNIYTLLLLAGLGYFGLRLHSSYHDLNRSHDDLEQRVHNRTRELQSTLNDLKESQVQLVQAEKMSSLGQLVAGVMHEINTPLLYVLNNASVSAELAQDFSEFMEVVSPILEAPDQDRAVEMLVASKNELAQIDMEGLHDSLTDMTTLTADSIEGLNQISELVQSLKDYSRLDRAGEDRFDVREGLEKTLLITKNVLKYGIEVEQDFEDVPDIYCSPSKLNQVFTNLITNAAQAMDGEGKLKISTRVHKDWVDISFEDSGCGIPEENLAKIMDPFFTTKPVGKGTGLGLSIVHKIVEEHGGQILIDSKEGVGTRITVGLPVRRDALAEDEKGHKVEAA